jgi:LysM repeat protein
MAARSRWRYLGPIALLAVIIATALVIRSGLQKHDSAAAPPTATVAVSRHHGPHKKFYVVRAGDTLSAISVRTGVPIATLKALNPAVDPSALQLGQRLRLSR